MTEPARTSEPAARPSADAPAPAEPARPAVKLPASAVELRRARFRKLAIRFAVFVALPTLLAIVFYGGLASRQYDAIAVIAIESQADNPREVAARGGTVHQRDARLLRDYIQSRTMLDLLGRDHGLIAHYQGADIDWWSRLSADAGGDETHAYYRGKVATLIDRDSSAVEVRVRAFSPARAQELLAAIVEASDAWVRARSARARIELIEPAEQEVSRARERLVEARKAMLVVTGGTAPTPEQQADPIVMEHELAELALAGTLEALQRARLEATHAQRYLAVIDPPSRPDQVSRPRLLWDITTVFVSALVLVSVLSLLGAAVREHAKF